jgi:hypothetical protein
MQNVPSENPRFRDSEEGDPTPYPSTLDVVLYCRQGMAKGRPRPYRTHPSG